MPSNPPFPATARSPLLMNRKDTLLLVIDAQEKLWPHIAHHADLLPRLSLLVDAARILAIQTLATEQYVKGLGPTIEPLRGKLNQRLEKQAFSAGIEPTILDRLDPLGIRKILLVGIETHVCVAQTALDLLASGFQVYVAVDAVGSRRSTDKEIALRRLENAGVVLTTSEAVVFEWTVVAGSDEFKQISALVKSVPL